MSYDAFTEGHAEVNTGHPCSQEIGHPFILLLKFLQSKNKVYIVD